MEELKDGVDRQGLQTAYENAKGGVLDYNEWDWAA